jgi:hypothetical protein
MAAVLLTSIVSVVHLGGAAIAGTSTVDVDAGGFDPSRIGVRLGDDVQLVERRYDGASGPLG